MSVMLWPDKDPDELLDYGFDWSRFLAGDSIISSEWDVPEGLALEATVLKTPIAGVWLSGGLLGERYRIRNTIMTAGGRIADRTASLKIRSK